MFKLCLKIISIPLLVASDKKVNLTFIGTPDELVVLQHDPLGAFLETTTNVLMDRYRRSLFYPRGCFVLSEVMSVALQWQGLRHSICHNTAYQHCFLRYTTQSSQVFYLDYTAEQHKGQQGALIVSELSTQDNTTPLYSIYNQDNYICISFPYNNERTVSHMAQGIIQYMDRYVEKKEKLVINYAAIRTDSAVSLKEADTISISPLDGYFSFSCYGSTLAKTIY